MYNTIQTFKPNLLFRNRHIQTVLGSRQPAKKLPTPEEELISIDAQRYVYARLYTNPSDELVVLLHGLGGNTQSKYLQATTDILWQHGYNVACVSLPGNEDAGAYLYHAGDDDAFDEILSYYAKTFLCTHWIGFSFSGNLLLRWLRSPKQIKTAISISPVTDLYKSVLKIDSPSYWLYRKYFLNKLIALYKIKKTSHASLFDKYKNALQSRTIQQFDERFTCPFHGYKSPLEYYTANSSVQNIDQIQNKTFILYAKDDPFISTEDLRSSTNPHLNIIETAYGGHVSFYQSLSRGFQYPLWVLKLLQS